MENKKFKWYETFWIDWLITLPITMGAVFLWYYFNSLIPIFIALVIGFLLGFTKSLEKPVYKIACWWYK